MVSTRTKVKAQRKAQQMKIYYHIIKAKKAKAVKQSEAVKLHDSSAHDSKFGTRKGSTLVMGTVEIFIKLGNSLQKF